MKFIALFLTCISLINALDDCEEYHHTPTTFFSTTIGDTADFIIGITISTAQLVYWPFQSTYEALYSFFPDYDGDDK